jgi:RimJ/RimL family protein N-acetyltransferase
MLKRSISLTDGEILVRPPLAEDATGFYQAIVETMDELEYWMSLTTAGYSITRVETWIEKQPETWQARREFIFLICETYAGGILGSCGLNQVDWFHRMAGLAYWVRSSQRGRGIAARAAKLVSRFGFETLDLLRVEVVVSVENQASLRVAEKLGAHKEGILRNRIYVGGQIGEAVMFSLTPGDFGLPIPRDIGS